MKEERRKKQGELDQLEGERGIPSVTLKRPKGNRAIGFAFLALIIVVGSTLAYAAIIKGHKDKEAKKNQHIVEVKEIRMSPGIGDNDFGTKLKSAQKFIHDGDRVKVSVRFRGREMAHTNLGEILLKEFAEKCSDIAVLDKEPKLEGRSMSIFISPKQSSANK